MDDANRTITIEESGAFVEAFRLGPTGAGPLDGLRFAVKDLIDVGGRRTGCGNPDWHDGHPAASAHAVCVEQLLGAGAECVGKTITDELAFGLLGENAFWGTPLNPKAPDRVPGGSSSGSASAVACGLADFALGTDTGGSVRIPSANCGLFGLRPSHGVVSVAGVNPFAPTFDTVGLLARSAAALREAASVLLGSGPTPGAEVAEVLLVREAFANADPGVVEALEPSIGRLKELFGAKVRAFSIREVDGEPEGTGLRTWLETYCALQWAENWSILGPWIEATTPRFGPLVEEGFGRARGLDRTLIGPIVGRRESYARRLRSILGPGTLLCMPTAPIVAPVRGSITSRSGDGTDYFTRTLCQTSLSGVGRLPELTLPLAEADGAPVGLSLLAAQGNDPLLLGVVDLLARAGIG